MGHLVTFQTRSSWLADHCQIKGLIKGHFYYWSYYLTIWKEVDLNNEYPCGAPAFSQTIYSNKIYQGIVFKFSDINCCLPFNYSISIGSRSKFNKNYQIKIKIN